MENIIYTQCELILKAMLENKDIEWWNAKMFQNGKWFIGYEASARMSDLVRTYPDLFEKGRDGRFRLLKINWKNEKLINELKEMLEIKKVVG